MLKKTKHISEKQILLLSFKLLKKIELIFLIIIELTLITNVFVIVL